ncbi:MAG: DUF4157 domain-containing protein, partial [Ramlibacter sp.]|nr:DUF4157 domain-containing protein [Ramlibacter sp.]
MNQKSHGSQSARAAPAASTAAPEGRAAEPSTLDNSPVLLAQRRKFAAAFGPAAQLREEAPAGRSGLPASLKTGIESMSGMDMSDVRVHRNSAQPKQLNALAYAQGNDIHLGPGQDQHLPHEAWHVVQQRQGRVQPTVQIGGSPVNDEPALEREADTMGQRAATAGSAGDGPLQRAVASARPVVQAVISTGDFKTATYGFGKRRRSIGPVDIALATYIGARTIANALALWGAANNYLHGAGHAAGRILAVTALRDQADEEHRLLSNIGNANAHLVDALLLQAAGQVGHLIVLANAVTPAHANLLPGLINAIGGAANIAAFNAQHIVAHITPAQTPLLLPLLPLVGGFGQLAALDAAV